MSPQQATIGPAPMEGVERTNAGVVRGQGTGIPLRWDPYAMEVDRGRNCYACGGFGHMARHCGNRERERSMEGRRVDVKIVDGGLYFIFHFHFYFTFLFFFF